MNNLYTKTIKKRIKYKIELGFDKKKARNISSF